ncbi:hypothetical protein [Streptosporangium sp. NBC_01756]|uniref:hypothetical protein n=1 Tax=Streptosporangium sp. NBC_01756 TaxID=2975950 RepID=UPI002DDA240E|nr:hypothetical protein [Streptosporangium sp. NBC_01756]WSC88862.1 hypothetical protein OIE48_11965 [Streptosporangium sp. NBC_01756]
MEYEKDVVIYTAAAGMTTVAALTLKRKKALAISLAIGLMVSNPGSMKKCAVEWRGEGKSGTEADVHRIRDEITSLKNKIKADKHWEGEAADTFNAAADELLAALDEDHKYRTCAADTLDQTAVAYHAGAYFAATVATAMTSLMTAYLISRPFPQFKAVVDRMIDPVLNRIDSVVKAVVTRKMTLVAGAGAVLAAVNGFQYDQKHLFMGMKALPEKEPDFTQAGLQYDKKSHSLKKKVIA